MKYIKSQCDNVAKLESVKNGNLVSKPENHNLRRKAKIEIKL